ncbi:Retrovirus-related Pol polyprotein LINE-1 [Cricetulus griseus]|uniref:Retrovirus-related Pol polyprotein LINE-1 n=1 Tax=Cricetulus griseus TaxID=10029 RepID=G3HQD9_CRIGR|nr:Retrovirus-related Pol polyprotein LINE-1 [Cricetulus griseus]
MIILHVQVSLSPEMQVRSHILKSINIVSHINRLKDKSHVIISLATQGAFDNMQQHFMIKQP